MLGLNISDDSTVWVATTTVLPCVDPAGRWVAAMGLAASADALWAATSEALYRIDPHKLGSTVWSATVNSRIPSRQGPRVLPAA